MAKQILTNLDFNSASRILNLPNAVGDQEPATLAQLKAVQEGLAWKDEVKVASNGSNINLSAPGATIDGITMVANDRVLIKDQTAQTENGIYIWNGAATPMTRALDANGSGELTQAVVTVDQGTSAGSTYRQSTVNPTVGTSNIIWGSFGVVTPPATTSTAGVAALATQAEVNAGVVTNKIVTPETLASWTGRIKKYSTNIGDGSATSYAVTHNLNSRDVSVAVYRNSGSYDEVLVDTNHTDVNTVTLVFAVAPAAAAFRVVVMG